MVSYTFLSLNQPRIPLCRFSSLKFSLLGHQHLQPLMQHNRKLEKEIIMKFFIKVSAQPLCRIQSRTYTFFLCKLYCFKIHPVLDCRLRRMPQHIPHQNDSGPNNRSICWCSVSLWPRFEPSVAHNKAQDIIPIEQGSVNNTYNTDVVSPKKYFYG